MFVMNTLHTKTNKAKQQNYRGLPLQEKNNLSFPPLCRPYQIFYFPSVFLSLFQWKTEIIRKKKKKTNVQLSHDYSRNK